MINALDIKIKRLKEKALNLPLTSGVYIMKNKDGNVIYVGKAKVLKDRVVSYFRNISSHHPKVYKMVVAADDFDYILTDSEFEALVLECSMIKQHSPKYNILLKDDKGYSFIEITNEMYPRMKMVRKNVSLKSEYIGPYTNSYVVTETVKALNKIFGFPTCNRKFPEDFRKSRPCLHYHIKECVGVCTGKVNPDEYMKSFSMALNIIKNGGKDVINQLKTEMESLSQKMEYEKAAKIRDRINTIKKIHEKQKVIIDSNITQDVIAAVTSEKGSCISLIEMRNGILTDKLDFYFPDYYELSTLRHEFVTLYYQNAEDIPKRVLLDGKCDDPELTERYLSRIANKKITLHIPQRNEHFELCNMARKNAEEKLNERMGFQNRNERILERLKQMLGLPTIPQYVEAYDISNIGDDYMVGGMIVYKCGKPCKKMYRKFEIKGQIIQNDYSAMHEVISRRIERYFNKNKQQSDDSFSHKPDLILLDGGKGHLSTIKQLLCEMNFEVPVFGMVKDSKHKTRAITSEGGEITITSDKDVLNLITEIQNEVHRFAIGYQRQKQNKKMLKSALTEIDGIGEIKARNLLSHFITIDKVKSASTAELQKVGGISKKNAIEIYKYYHPNLNADAYEQTE